MNPLFHIKPVSSRWLSYYMLMLYVLAGIAIVIAGLPVTFKWVLLLLLLVVAIRIRLSGNQISELKIAADGRASIRVGQGAELRVKIMHASVLQPLLTILEITTIAGGSHILRLLPDSASRNDLRRLRLLMQSRIANRDEERNYPG